MCGRYVIKTTPDLMRQLLGYPELPNFPPRYNIAPTQPVPIVRLNEGKRQFALVRWGLIPGWVKDPRGFSLLHVARSETVNEKPAFRYAMKRRRCLIPADGFYEWNESGRKEPYFVHAKSGGMIAFAGLWESWMGPNGEEVDSAVIVTVPANALLAPVCDRMPAIVPPEAFDLWLDGAHVDAETAVAMLAPAPDDLLALYEVATAVNRTINDGPELIAPSTSPPEPEPTAAAPVKRPRGPKKDERQSSLF
jgi:putative SOS response-associated peptidase YedK